MKGGPYPCLDQGERGKQDVAGVTREKPARPLGRQDFREAGPA
jgi:hypothetical protein